MSVISEGHRFIQQNETVLKYQRIPDLELEKYFGFMVKDFLIVLFFAGLCVGPNSTAYGQNWKTGRSFRDALIGKTRFQSNGTLKQELTALSRNSSVAIFLDREIDPNQKIEFPSTLQPLGKSLDQVAEKVDGLALSVGSFVYIAPKEKALRYLVLKNIQSYSQPASFQETLGQTSELKWSYLSNPRDTISVVAANLDLKLKNPEQIPHDLWAEQNLPRLYKWEQLTFLLATLNLSFKIDAAEQSLEVFELADGLVMTTKFRKSEATKIRQAISKSKLASTKYVERGSDFFVRGPLSELTELMDQTRVVRKWKSTIKAGSKDVFDLKTSASRGQILATIAKNRNVELKFTPDMNEALRQKVSIDVKQVTAEELISETLKGTRLRFQLNEKQLLILK